VLKTASLFLYPYIHINPLTQLFMKKSSSILALLVSVLALSGLSSCDPQETETPATKYSVTVSSAGHGTAGAGVKEAEAGQVVTIEATADADYEFSKWVVVAGGATPESYTSAKTTFRMPEADVSIRAEFAAKELPKYSITITADENGSAEADITEAQAGTSVTITATPNDPENWKFDKWTVVEGDVELADPLSAQTTFLMPDGNIAIKAEFSEIPKYSIVITAEGNGTAEADVTEAQAGTSVTITATPDDPENWQFDHWDVVSGGAELQDAAAAETTFTMPDSDVAIEAVFAEIVKYKITTANSSPVGATEAEYTEAVAGTVVTVKAIPASNAYLFDTWSGSIYTPYGALEFTDATSAETTFVMPASDVYVEAFFKRDPSALAQPGDFVYYNGYDRASFQPLFVYSIQPIEGQKCFGILVSNDADGYPTVVSINQGYELGLTEEELVTVLGVIRFQTTAEEVENDDSSKRNYTGEMMVYADENGLDFAPWRYPYEYLSEVSFDGFPYSEDTRQWYLPSVYQFKELLMPVLDKVNASLQALGKPTIEGTYWMTNQASATDGWEYNVDNNTFATARKTEKKSVLPFHSSILYLTPAE
jgi:hypothetical protein